MPEPTRRPYERRRPRASPRPVPDPTTVEVARSDAVRRGRGRADGADAPDEPPRRRGGRREPSRPSCRSSSRAPASSWPDVSSRVCSSSHRHRRGRRRLVASGGDRGRFSATSSSRASCSAIVALDGAIFAWRALGHRRCVVGRHSTAPKTLLSVVTLVVAPGAAGATHFVIGAQVMAARDTVEAVFRLRRHGGRRLRRNPGRDRRAEPDAGPRRRRRPAGHDRRADARPDHRPRRPTPAPGR